jgi:transcriptional regulator with GAF, ATPase, and Fis domain
MNCSAIPVNLIESELFGNEKGALSSADPEPKAGNAFPAITTLGLNSPELHESLDRHYSQNPSKWLATISGEIPK